MRRFLICGAVCLGLLAGTGAAAQGYPAKPVRIIVTSSPGAASDMMARIMADQLSKAMGASFVVENKPGAGGNIAGEYVARAAADGYTLLLASVSSHAINPALYSNMPYDPVKDFEHISVLVSNPNALVVSPALDVSSVPELIKLAASSPGTLNFSSGGVGTSQHLAGELFKSLAKVDILHIPYKGSPEALSAVMRNETALMFPNIPNAMTLAESGRVKLLAVTTKERLSWLPDVPSLHESGLEGFEAVAWFGLVAPAGTPAAVVKQVSDASRQVLAQPDIRKQLIEQGFDIIAGTPEHFQTFLADELVKWDQAVRLSGVPKQ